jgi:hypothetical protein
MAKTRYRKKTRRLRTRRKYKRGGAPTEAQIKQSYSTRDWKSRPAALNIHKSPSSSEKRRNKEKEEKRKEEERKKEEEIEEKKGLVQSMKSWRDSRKELSDKFKKKFLA